MIATASAVLNALALRQHIKDLEDPESAAKLFLADVDLVMGRNGLADPLDQAGAELVALTLYAEGWNGDAV